MVETAPRPASSPLVGPHGPPAALRFLACLAALATLPPPALGAAQGAAAAYPLACHYVRRELDRFEACARHEGGMIRVAPTHVARMRFERGLAELRVPGIGCLWARRDGLALPVFTLDNGPDPFAQGLVRGWREDKVAFYDRRLRLVLATPYDWAFPFDARGEALVCKGCRSDGRDPASMIGGRWGIIDRKGRLVRRLAEGDAAADHFFGRR